MADAKPIAKKLMLTDPLEAAKMAKPLPPETAVPDAPPVTITAVLPDPPAVKLVQYRVAATANISLNGQIIRLNKDDVISAESYGPENMAKILAGNAVLIAL